MLKQKEKKSFVSLFTILRWLFGSDNISYAPFQTKSECYNTAIKCSKPTSTKRASAVVSERLLSQVKLNTHSEWAVILRLIVVFFFRVRGSQHVLVAFSFSLDVRAQLKHHQRMFALAGGSAGERPFCCFHPLNEYLQGVFLQTV